MGDIQPQEPTELDLGRQLIERYQAVWATEFREERLVPLSPSFGVEKAVQDLELTRASIPELSEEQLAAIGKQSLHGFFNWERRETKIAEAASEKSAARQALADLVKQLSGSLVTARALDPNDKPITIRSNRDRSFRMRIRELDVVTGILTPRSADPWFHGFSTDDFDSEILRLARPRHKPLPGPFSHYAVHMIDWWSCVTGYAKPRVSLSIKRP